MCPYLQDKITPNSVKKNQIFFDFLKIYNELRKSQEILDLPTPFPWRNSLLKMQAPIGLNFFTFFLFFQSDYW